MFYEQKNSLEPDLLKVETGTDFSFPAHLHSSFEVITVTSGEMTVIVDKKQYNITKGTAVLVFPNEVHSLSTPKHSSHILCIFSPQLVKAYSNSCLLKSPDSHLFSIDEHYVNQLSELKEHRGIPAVKGALYSICAEFDKTATYSLQAPRENELLMSIFRFIEDNYSKDCSLKAISEYTSYHEVYLSRYFKQCTGLSLTDHINRYRVNEACYMLMNSREKILQIAFDCGFDSLRSFNRNFKSITGMTPGAYRSKNR